MKKFIILTEAQARALRTLLNAVFDLPMTETVAAQTMSRVGSGVHAPWSQCRTMEHGRVRKHPTQDLWAYPIDDRLRAVWQAYQDGTLPPAMKSRIDSLTSAQKTAIRDAVRDAVELTEDWRMNVFP